MKTNSNTGLSNKTFPVRFLLIFLIGLTLSLNSCEKEEVTNEPEPEIPVIIDNSLLAPAFELKALSGETVKFSDFKNKVVVLFFFGNTCPSCKSVAPDIENMLHKVYGSNASFALLGLDQWDGNSNLVQSFKTATGASFPLLLNASPVAKLYSSTYDRLIVIDKAGKIAFSGKQLAVNDLNTVKTKVADLLK